MSLSAVRTAALGLLLITSLGCGGDDDASDASADTTATTSAGTTATTSAGTAATGGEECGDPVVVTIADFAFAPEDIEVAAGCEVVWRNDDTQPHTSSGTGAETWSTGNIDPGATSDPVTVTAPGDLPYRCALHPFMTAAVTVT